jgi:hypothetical protein
MGEIRDLVGIFGAIDRAAAADAHVRQAVGRLLPLYRRSDVRWFDDFEAWTKELRSEQSDTPPFPESLDEALDGLAKTPPKGRMMARRMFAIAGALQAFPDVGTDAGGQWRDSAARALAPGLVEQSVDHGRSVLAILGDENLLPKQDTPEARDAWWHDVLEKARSGGHIENPELTIGPRPCAGRVSAADCGLVATIESGFTTSAVAFDRACSFLHPTNWPRCSHRFWCEMDDCGEVRPGVHHFHEVVSTDCKNRALAWTISAELDFKFTQLPGLAIAEYQLHEGHPKPGDAVLVDEGSLVVHELGGGESRVITTKRVRFDYPFSVEALALIMCALGYASLVEDLVFTCAALKEKKGTAFPGTGTEPTRTVPKPKHPADEIGDRLKACVDHYAETARAASEKTAAGTYTADALAQDIAQMWVRAAREWSDLVQLGTRSAQAAGAQAPRRRPGPRR